MSKESKEKAVTLKKEVEDRRIYDYWMSAFKRAAKKMPVKDWEIAETRFKADDKGDKQNKPVVNDLRNHVEVSRAYLDQREPSFKVSVTPAYASNEKVQQMAKAEARYLEYVWPEQDCQVAESQKLDSALVRNVGFTMPVFDMKKWMPGLRYLPARDVRLDPDCGGIMARASWVAYREDISVEQLKADVPDVTAEEILRIKNKNPSVLTEEEQEDVDDKEKELYLSVRRWHVFARNDAAVRDFTKEVDEPENVESLVDELKLKTERRYLQFVEGIPRPVKDEKTWPFDLDHDEFPITQLMLNQVPEDLYGFTDYKQMERMDSMSDVMMRLIEKDAWFATITKYLKSKEAGAITNETIDNWLNKPERAVLEDMVDEAGKPLLVEAAVGSLKPELPSYYELFHNESISASGDAELDLKSIADYKEVTAMGVRADIERRHRRTNLRLGGSRGFEKSIQEDAVKMLEIAHQFVPRFSVVETEAGLEQMPWAQAEEALAGGASLVKLGADAIIGEELADGWVTSDDVSMTAIRLSTKVRVTPGSTRNLTQEQQAASFIELYSNVLYPTIYEPMRRFDLAVKFLDYVGEFMQGLDRIQDFLPTDTDIKQFLEQQQQQAEQEAQAEQEKAELEMQVAQAKGDNEQRSAELQLGTESVKAEIEIDRDMKKTENEERKAKLQLQSAGKGK